MLGKIWQRRAWLGGAGVVGLASAGSLFCRAASFPWGDGAGERSGPMAPPPRRPQLQRWSEQGLHAAWLGHSTVLLRMDGFTILTDPILSDRAGLSLGPLTFGIRRLVAPALDFWQLPHIDLILLSHAHLDHFDLPTLARLEGPHTTVITAWQTSDLLRPDRYRAVYELMWGEQVRVGPVLCRAFEVKHWGARLRSDTFRGYNGYAVEAGRHRVVFAGDTAWTPSLRALRRARPLDLAIMPIGAYNPWLRNHCTPEQAWQMGNDAGAEFLLPVHHQTFRLSQEPLLEPIERLRSAAAGQEDRVALEKIGQEFHLS